MSNTPLNLPSSERSPETIRKIVFFGLVGAAGCLAGAVLGEPLYSLVPRPTAGGTKQIDVLFVLDATGSMQAQIDGVQHGIVEFARELSQRGLDENVGLVAFRDESFDGPAEVLQFSNGPFTADYGEFRRKVGDVEAHGGGDDAESSFEALRIAAGQPFRRGSTRVLLLITDAPPKIPERETAGVEDVAAALTQSGISQLHLVINKGDSRHYAPLQAGRDGEIVDLGSIASGSGGFDRILPAVGEKIAEATIRGLASNAAVDVAYVPRQLGITALWTGLLAAGVALALVAGQNHYLHKSPLTIEQGLVGLLGGIGVGLVAGGFGQAIAFAPQFPSLGIAASLGAVLAQFLAVCGMLLGWALLGGMLGRGLAAFVPNLGAVPAVVGGVVGGVAAAVGFMAASGLLGDLFGRLCGAGLLGFCIGAMLALIEAATRDFYLEVRYGTREIVKVSLGAAPVTVGADGRTCTVFAASSPRPILYKYWVADDKVQLLDYATEQASVVAANDERTIGSITLTVRNGSVPERTAAGAALAPTPTRAVSGAANSRPAVPPPPTPPPTRPPAAGAVQRSVPSAPPASSPVRRSPPPPPPPPPKTG
jgi:Ca-activated chloride channel family protein